MMIILCLVVTFNLLLSADSKLVIPDEAGFVNNWKLLLSEKSCEATEYHPQLAKTVLACEERTASLNCSDQSDTAIVVCDVLFGRDNLHECAPARSTDAQCFSLDAINVVTEECQWKSHCSVKASKHVFADPCPHQSKFLRVQYMCINKLYAASLLTTTSTTTEAPPEGKTTTQPKFCPSTEERGIYWPETEGGKNAFMDCPGAVPIISSGKLIGKKRRDLPYARFKCGIDGSWRGRPDLSRCESEFGVEMKKIADEVAHGTKPIVEAAKLVETKVTSAKMSYGGDLMSTVEAIQKTANVSARTEAAVPAALETGTLTQVAKSLARSGSAVLSDEQFQLWGDLPEFKKDQTASRLIEGIEQSMMTEAEARRKKLVPSVAPGVTEADVSESSSVHLETNVIAEVAIVNVEKLQSKNEEFPAQLKERKKKQEREDVKIFLDDAESVIMPTSQLKKYSKQGLAKVVYIQYRNLERFMGYSAELPIFNDSFSQQSVDNGFDEGGLSDETAYVDFPAAGQSRTHILNSKVITISMGDRRVKMELDEPVIFTLRHEKIDERHRPKCCFWDYNPWTYHGAWSAQGCYRVRTNATHTTCGCNHLTSFAILVDVSGQDAEAPEHDRISLSMITTVGCTISSVCLLLFWFTFQFVDRKLDSDQRTVHKHLAICLFFGEVLFVAGIRHAVIHNLACRLVAGCLQFFFTSAFVWMLLEGVQIVIKLNELVPSGTKKWPIYYLTAYGTSTLLVGITAGVSNLEAYGNGEICWLHDAWLFYFVVPVGIIILINLFILAYLIYKACSLISHNDHIVSAAGKESKLYQTRSTIKGITAATILLGLTWSCGFLYVNQHFIFAAYLFSIFNSLQGFLIFLFFCVFNKWVRRQYAAWCRSNICGSSSSSSTNYDQNNNRKNKAEGVAENPPLLGENYHLDSETQTSSSCCFPSSSRGGSSSGNNKNRAVRNCRGGYYQVTPSSAPPAYNNNNNNTNPTTSSTTDHQSSSSQFLLSSSSSSATTNNNNNRQSLSSSSANNKNQNILVRMFKNRTKLGATARSNSNQQQQQQDQRQITAISEVVVVKSFSPDLTPGKCCDHQIQQDGNQHQHLLQTATAVMIPLDPEEQPSSSGQSKEAVQNPSQSSQTSGIIVKIEADLHAANNNNQQQQPQKILVANNNNNNSKTLSYSNNTYDSCCLITDSCNTENVTDYMQQAFLTTAQQQTETAQELRDFDANFGSPDDGGGILAAIASLDEEEEDKDKVGLLPLQQSVVDQQGQSPKQSPPPLYYNFCSKSKTFSDFLSALVQQHEEGLIDEEMAQVQNRMFVSRIFERNNDDNNERREVASPSHTTSVSSSSLSISAIPDIYAPLDDLHLSLSTNSLENAARTSIPSVPVAKRNDSGFCSNKATGAEPFNDRSPIVDAEKQFPVRRIQRTCSDGEIVDKGLIKRKERKNDGDNQFDGDDEAGRMFDDSERDNLLLVDMTAPSQVRSLTFLPSIDTTT